MANKNVKSIDKSKRQLRVTGVGHTLHEELTNIASHIGTSLSDFAKNKLADIVHSYPEHYKKPLQD